MSNTSESALLNLLFKNQAWANVGDASGLQPSAAAGNFYVRLHSDDPGETGTGDTSEIAYAGYEPVAVARGYDGFNVSGAVVSSTVQFGECTAGMATVTHFSVCVDNGAGAAIVYRGALGATRNISAGITPLFNVGALSGTID